MSDPTTDYAGFELLDPSATQFRISSVQVTNWGPYHGHHTMPVHRAGTAVLGPTGIGKSTILDAMLAVMMPNPLVFNRAARDDTGGKSERTVYSYARGMIDTLLNENTLSVSSHYLRPPGNNFFTAAAITWTDDRGVQITGARVVWVPLDASSNAELNPYTRYLLVKGAFDLAQLNAAAQAPIRDGRSSSPLGTTALKRLVDRDRGLVTDSQEQYAQRMRKLLGIGSTEEGGRRALQLLQRAQASKGVSSINDLFKTFVLEEPLALVRWETALEAFREASALYQEFETARAQLQVLAPLSTLAQQYRTAAAQHDRLQSLTEPLGDAAPSPARIHHDRCTVEWAEARIRDNRIQHRARNTEARGLEHQVNNLKITMEDANRCYYNGGGNNWESLNRRREDAQRAVQEKRSAYNLFRGYCHSVDHDVSQTLEDFHAIQTWAADQLGKIPVRKQELDKQLIEAAGSKSKYGDRLKELEMDLASYRRRRSNIPRAFIDVREHIAAHTGVAVERLPFAGELMEVSGQHRRWAKAVDRVLGGFARHLLVSPTDWSRVTGYVNTHDMGERVQLTRANVGAGSQEPQAEPGTIPAMVEIAAESEYRFWLLKYLIRRYSYLAVETAQQLEDYPEHLRGAVTREGMVTSGPDSRIKDDRRDQRSWLGFDNAATIYALETEVAGVQQQVDQTKAELEGIDRQHAALRSRGEHLQAIVDQQWHHIDIRAAQQALEDLELEAAQLQEKAPDLETLQISKERAFTAWEEASDLHKQAMRTVWDLEQEWEQLVSVEDEAKDRLEAHPVVDPEVAEALAPFTWPPPTTVDQVDDSFQALEDAITGQMSEQKTAQSLARTELTAVFRIFLHSHNRPGLEADDTINSLETFEAIHQELLTDALPTARQSWLRKTRQDIIGSLRTLLVQIEQDRLSIRTRLEPINQALEAVEFRAGTRLEIDTDKPVPTTDLDEFRATIRKYTSQTLHHSDEEDTERMFVALRRDLGRLDDQSQSAEAWRRRVFDAREHVEFRAIERRTGQSPIVHDGVSGKSGGEGQELIAFILGAALRYQLGDGTLRVPKFAPVVLDEGFVKTDEEHTGRALQALQTLGFQLIIGAPKGKAQAFEDYVGSVVYVNRIHPEGKKVRMYQYNYEDL